MSLEHAASAAGSVLAFALVTSACAAPEDVSDFSAPSAASNKGATGTGPIAKGSTTTKPSDDLAACATSTAAAQAKPVTLVFAYDRSLSMEDDGKWESAKAAMKAFFSSPDSAGVSASMTFFPAGYDFCGVGNYTTPHVALTALPSPAFGTTLDAMYTDSGTPTYSALAGTLTYAKGLKAAAPDTTVAVVMVTDGEPMGCNDHGNPGVAASAAAAVAATIPTYVVGVGDDLAALNTIAQSGGTNSAFLVSVGNPTQTQQELSQAINQIRSSAVSCDYAIPTPPNGETFDRAKVNVQYTPSSGAATSIGYDQACTGGTGWKYDDANNPTRVLACDATCSQIKAASGKVDIVFGCATKAGTVN